MNQGLFDNDILSKLIDCGLMDDAQQILNISETWVLSSLASQLKPNSTGKFAKRFKTLPQISQENVRLFVSNAKRLPSPVNHDFVDRCTNEHLLDPGETLLLEAALHTESPLLITADKRFLNSFAQIQWLQKEHSQQLNARFVCLESILLQLIDTYGFDVILAKVSESKHRITELQNIFGGEYNKPEELARERLNYEISLLRDKLGSFLYTHVVNN